MACGIVADPVAVRSAVSLRDVLGAAADPVALGCYIGVNTTMIESGAGSVLELARRYQRELVRSILGTSLRKRTFPVPALRAAMASAERRDAFQPGVGITNIGRVAPAAGLRGIRLRHYLPLARRLSNANGCVLHVHSLDERLALTLVYPEPNFAPYLAAAILADLGDGLTALAQDAAKVAA